MAAAGKRLTQPAKAVKPASSRRRSAEPVSTEEHILATAEKLFSRHGFDAVSTKLLASESGLTIGAIYHYFPSKEALYAAATRHVFATKTTLPETIRVSVEPAERKLARLCGWFVSLIVTDQPLGLLIQRELLDPRADPAALLDSDLFHDAFNLFQELLAELLPDADSDEALGSMLALLFGYANLKGLNKLAPRIRSMLSTPDEIGTHATALLLHGLKR